MAWAAVAQAGSELTNTAINYFGGAHQSKLQRRWAERMDNTKFQRRAADLKLAGLNPMLSYVQGAAGSPPGGAAAGSPGAQLGGGVRAYLDAKKQKAEIKLLESQQKTEHQRSFVEFGKRSLVHDQSLKTNQEWKLLQTQMPEASANATLYEGSQGAWFKAAEKFLGRQPVNVMGGRKRKK